jgi:hypothetical protein
MNAILSNKPKPEPLDWNEFVKRMALVAGAAALCALIYLRYMPPIPAQKPVQHPEILRLSTLVDGHINSIFSPLDGKVPPIPHQELRTLRESFADALNKSTGEEKALYKTAIDLSDVLLAAIRERETAAVSLGDTRSKPYSVALSPDQRKAEKEKRDFFEFSILRRWSDNSRSYRDRTVRLYTQLRTEERNSDGK